MGLIIGSIQAIAGHRYLSPRAWILGNAIGWAPAMAIIIEAATPKDHCLVDTTAPAFGCSGLDRVRGRHLTDP